MIRENQIPWKIPLSRKHPMYSEDHLDWKNWKQAEMWHIQTCWKCQKVFHQNHLVVRIKCVTYLQLRIPGVLLHRYSGNLMDNWVLEDVRGSVNLPLSKKHFSIAVFNFAVFNQSPHYIAGSFTPHTPAESLPPSHMQWIEWIVTCQLGSGVQEPENPHICRELHWK